MDLDRFSPRFYNFLTFISYALKNIRSIGQSIRKMKHWVRGYLTLSGSLIALWGRHRSKQEDPTSPLRGLDDRPPSRWERGERPCHLRNDWNLESLWLLLNFSRPRATISPNFLKMRNLFKGTCRCDQCTRSPECDHETGIPFGMHPAEGKGDGGRSSISPAATEIDWPSNPNFLMPRP